MEAGDDSRGSTGGIVNIMLESQKFRVFDGMASRSSDAGYTGQ